MRTTIDLPDELLRHAKAAAALRGIKLKDLIASFVERGLETTATRSERGHRDALPEFVPHTGQPIRSLSGADIEELLLRVDLESLAGDRSS